MVTTRNDYEWGYRCPFLICLRERDGRFLKENSQRNHRMVPWCMSERIERNVNEIQLEDVITNILMID